MGGRDTDLLYNQSILKKGIAAVSHVNFVAVKTNTVKCSPSGGGTASEERAST